MVQARKAKPKRGKRRSWTEAHARRLTWRAGFGATPSETAELARLGKTKAIGRMLNGDGKTELRGPAPTVAGQPLDPVNEFDHDVLWWLDRMVRTNHPLEERMTLFWHDHFATAETDAPLMLAQNATLRRHALGTFDDLLEAVFLDPAMQVHLSIIGSHKNDPNENFARELFELYCFGAGKGYTEDDIREAARALTGWVGVRANGKLTGTRFDASRHDDTARRRSSGRPATGAGRTCCG